MINLLIILSLGSLPLTWGAARADSHDDANSAHGLRPRAENPQAKKKGEPDSYLPCDDSGNAAQVARQVSASSILRGLVVPSEDGSWRLARVQDLERAGKTKCVSLITDQNEKILGQYTPNFGKSFCKLLFSMVPGEMIPSKKGASPFIRYLPIRLPGAGIDGPFFWLPVPCGLQNSDTILALQLQSGRKSFAGFRQTAGGGWGALEGKPLADLMRREMALEFELSGAQGNSDKNCLAKVNGRGTVAQGIPGLPEDDPNGI